MTAAHLTKMREGKALADAARRRRHVAQKDQYMAWLADESRAFEIRQTIARELGRHTQAFHEADKRWADVLKLMPTTPPDSAWS